MRKSILAFLILSVFTNITNAQNDSIPQTFKQQKKAIKIATQWVNLITEGEDINSLLQISSLPFALDKSELLNSKDELKSFYLQIIKNVGQGSAPKLTAEIYDSEYKIIEDIIPINVLIIKVTILEGELKDDAIYLTVNISGNEMNINGFAD